MARRNQLTRAGRRGQPRHKACECTHCLLAARPRPAKAGVDTSQLPTDEWLQRIGECLRDRRLQRNQTQAEIAARAGLGRSAVQNLEAGNGLIETLVRVLRALGSEDFLIALATPPILNPIHMLRQGRHRRRASGRRNKPSQE